MPECARGRELAIVLIGRPTLFQPRGALQMGYVALYGTERGVHYANRLPGKYMFVGIISALLRRADLILYAEWWRP